MVALAGGNRWQAVPIDDSVVCIHFVRGMCSDKEHCTIYVQEQNVESTCGRVVSPLRQNGRRYVTTYLVDS
jgi:hypothetical protein